MGPGRSPGIGRIQRSRPTSRLGALWVSQPIDSRSTPLSAMARAVAGVMPPEASVTRRPATRSTPEPEPLGPEVVEQHGVGADLEQLVELLERVDLHLDLHQVADPGPHPPHGLGDRAGQDEVVVLDQHGVVEAEAVVGATAGPHRVLLQHPQAGRRLAGAGHDTPGCRPPRSTTSAVAVAMPDSRPSRLSAVRSAVSSERAGPSTAARTVPGADPGAVADRRLEPHGGVEELEGPGRHGEAGHHARLAGGDHARAGRRPGRRSPRWSGRRPAPEVLLRRRVGAGRRTAAGGAGSAGRRRSSRRPPGRGAASASAAGRASPTDVGATSGPLAGAGKSRRWWAPRLSRRASAPSATSRATSTALRPGRLPVVAASRASAVEPGDGVRQPRGVAHEAHLRPTAPAGPGRRPRPGRPRAGVEGVVREPRPRRRRRPARPARSATRERASAATRRPITTPSSREFEASRLAPCRPVAVTSPAAHSPGRLVRPARSVSHAAHAVVRGRRHRDRLAAGVEAGAGAVREHGREPLGKTVAQRPRASR